MPARSVRQATLRSSDDDNGHSPAVSPAFALLTMILPSVPEGSCRRWRARARASPRSPMVGPGSGERSEAILDRVNVERDADRARPTVPPASRTPLPTANETLWSSGRRTAPLPSPLEPPGNDAVGGIGESSSARGPQPSRTPAPSRSSQIGDLAVRFARSASLRTPYRRDRHDEDPDYESDENGRQRRDVVTEVEHRKRV